MKIDILLMTLICHGVLNASILNVDPQREDTNLQQEQIKGIQYLEDQHLQQEPSLGPQLNEDQNLQQEQTKDIQFEEDQSFRQERQIGR